MFKKLYYLFLIFLFMLPMLGSKALFANSINVDATSAILINGQNGKVIWSKNERARRPIASTTKIMTGILAIESLSMDDIIVADKSAEMTSGSEIYLTNNEKMTTRDMLYALLLQSANDSAMALAKHISGSIPKFSKKMNEKAKKIGLDDTDFKNPHGLLDLNTSTAFDMAQLGRYALNNKDFERIVATKSKTINGRTKRVVVNRNKLLWRYPFAIGIKTGYTKSAGYCLVSAARKNNILLVAATLNSSNTDSSFNNSIKIFNYGFATLKYVNIAKRREIVARASIPFSFSKMKLYLHEDFGVVVAKKNKIKVKIYLSNDLNLPIKKGDTVGEIRVFNGKNKIAKRVLKASYSIKDVGLFQKISFWMRSFFAK